MKIGELFLNLGIKGTDVSVRALASVKGGLEEAKDSGLALKAAILAALYGLERFTGAAGERGMELQKFADYTGLSAEKLQKWQYAMSLSGVAAKDVQGSVQGLQNAMLKMSIGEAPPKGMDWLSQTLGGNLDPKKFKDTFYMLDKLREYAKKETNVALRNETLSSFGLGPDFIQAMATSKVEIDKIKPSKILGQGEINQLAKVNESWTELHHTLELFGQQFVAKHGLSAVKDIAKVTEQVMKLVEAFARLSEKLRVFEVIGTIFEGWNNIFSWANAGVDKVSEMIGDHSKSKKPIKDVMTDALKKMMVPPESPADEAMHPKVQSGVGSGKIQNTNANITVHNHGVKDAKEGAHHVHKAVKGAFYQLQSQNMVT